MRSNFTFTLFLALVFTFAGNSSLFAQEQDALDIALRHLEQNRTDLQLTEADLASYRVSSFYRSKHNGLSHIYLKQQHQGIDVFNGLINVNILPDGKVLNMGNRFVSDLANTANTSSPSIKPEQAISEVIKTLVKKTPGDIVLLEQKDRQHFTFKSEDLANGEITAKLVFEVVSPQKVRLAWNVVLEEKDGQNWWNARVDAQTGTLLNHHNQVIHCDFGRPNSSCQDLTHKHSKKVEKNKRQEVPALPYKEENTFSANTYNVYPIGIESPNHGDRQLVSSPSNDLASPFGWHDTDGVPGPEYTITRGNNTHAYHDIFNLNASNNDEPDGGASLDFDFPLDLSLDRPYTQIDPIVVNLFFWNNLMHDVWYQYGFDEVAGNFQLNNYGNGGFEGDPMRAEALDGSGTNNANFSAGGLDGNAGRIQMYVWTDDNLPQIDIDPDSLTVLAPNDVIGRYEMRKGSFGGDLPSPPIMAEVVLADDGVDVTSDICEEIVNGAELVGKIAMIDRGDCQFGSKTLRAQNAGAIAVIICNNEPGVQGMTGGLDGGSVTIPLVMVSLEDCNKIKVGLPLSVEYGREDVDLEIPLPGPSGVTGDLDNVIIAHEYGHGISIRLTGGPNDNECLNNPERAGEGWSDWFGLVMTSTASNFADEPRGVGSYALGEPIDGDGIRTYRYTRDMDINPHVYSDIVNAAIPHGVGSVWCAMIWDLYWNLVDEYDYDEDLYNGTGGNNVAMQLVMDGLKLQPCSPSFVDARDAIIAADEANYNGENFCLIWKTFARRGLGVNASAGGNEDFETPAICNQVLEVKKTANVSEVDAGGVVTYTLEITNNESAGISSVSVEDQIPAGTSYVENSASCPASFSNGVLTFDLNSMDAGATISCSYQLKVADAPFSYALLDDGVEDGVDNWVVEAGQGIDVWETSNLSYEGNLAWFAVNTSGISDQLLTMKEAYVLDSPNPMLSFWHRFDTSPGIDGGVIEISTDGGSSWEDLGDKITQNGYSGTLTLTTGNPLQGRRAFYGTSGEYIQTLVNLSAYVGETVQIRFRFGTDSVGAADGWYVDNVELLGNVYTITNVACLNSSSSGDGDCAEATTRINGELNVSNRDLDFSFDLNIYPNPSKGKVFIEMKNPDRAAALVEVLSVDGRLFYAQKLDTSFGVHELDLTDLTEGIYMIKIQTDKSQVVRKLVIQ